MKTQRFDKNLTKAKQKKGDSAQKIPFLLQNVATL